MHVVDTIHDNYLFILKIINHLLYTSHMSRLCSICGNTKDNQEFYVINGRTMKVCKKCHIQRQSLRQRQISQARPKGFNKLPVDKREYCIKCLSMQVPKTIISKHIGVTVSTLNQWISKGQIEYTLE